MTPTPSSSDLTPRALLGRFLVQALREPPTAAWLAGLLPLLAELPLPAHNPDLVEGARLLQDWGLSVEGTPLAEVAAHLDSEYLRLFEGPGTVAAPPWESIYRSEDQILFGPTTLQVRAFYHRWGVSVEHLGSTPDDHIALELEFLLLLEERATQDDEAWAARDRFLKEHLLQWLSPFTSLVEDEAESLYFRGIARLLRGFVGAAVERPAR